MTAFASAAGAAEGGASFLARVRRDTEWLASRPTRVVGTQDHDEVLGELSDKLKSIPGVEVTVQKFPVIVPRTVLAGLTVSIGSSQETHRVYPVWPASVRLNTTPPEGIYGRLVYIGEGEPGRPPGKLPARSLRGQIAVMEVSGGHRWRHAHNAGATAIILLGSEDESNRHLHSHLVPIPIWVPRFYVPPGPLADALRSGLAWDGTLFCRAEWKEVTATNLYALVKPKNGGGEKALAVGVPFDSAGVVPELAAGADAAVDVAVALNALRDLARNRPGRPILFAFVDAYGINQLGLRQMLVALAVDPKSRTKRSHWEEDRRLFDDYGEHRELAQHLGLDRTALSGLHQAKYRALHGYVKDEVAREVLELEQKIHPLRLKKRSMEVTKLALETKLGAADVPAGGQRAKLKEEFSRLDVQMRALTEEIRELKGIRKAHHAAQDQLLTDAPVAEDAESLRLAQEIWRRARRRALKQFEELRAIRSAVAARDVLRCRLLGSLGITDTNERPVAFLLGLDLSDAGTAAGPCLQDRYLRVNETQNADSFCRWLKKLDKDKGEQVWPGSVRRATDLSPITGEDSRDSYLVGNLALFSSPAQSFGMPAATWTTLGAPRPRVDTPCDRADALDWTRLGPQVRATIALLNQLASDTEFAPSSKAYPLWHRVQGIIVDETPGEPVPRLPMGGYLTTLVGGRVGSGRAGVSFWAVAGVRRQQFCFTGIDGRFMFDAIPARTGVTRFHVQSYRLAPDGRIARAVDMLKVGKSVRVNVTLSATRPKPLRAVVFTCGELTALELFDPRFLVNLSSGSIIDARRGSAPKRLNLSRYGSLMSCQLEPGTRWQLVLRTGIAGNRMALLNMAEPKRGVKVRDAMRGFALGEPLPEHPLLIAARDFYRLNQKRLDDYAAAGIRSQAIVRLQETTASYLAQAERAIADDDGAVLFQAASGAMATVVRGYQGVRDTANDVIRGAIFLLLMAIPFAYAVERLLFASAHVYRQIAGVLVIFTVMAAALWQYHPAFEISSQPMMIVMAFAIIFMSLMVISVIFSRFESGLDELRSGRAETSGARTSRIGLLYTALRLGIANMRRRKFRTVLTGVTVVLITFAMLCFMSTSSYIGEREFTVGDDAPFTGVLVRQPTSRAMPPAALTHLQQIAGPSRTVVPRYWWTSQWDKKWRVRIQNRATGKWFSVLAALGLAPEEAGLTGADRACPNWARFADQGGCYLPKTAAEELGVKPGDTLVIAGQEVELIGILNSAVFNEELRRLDGESILPLDYAKMGDEERSMLTTTNMDRLAMELETGTTIEPDVQLAHVSSESVVVLPASMVAGIPGSTLRSAAVRTESVPEARDLASDLAHRLAFPIYYGSTDGVQVLAATPPRPRAPKSLIIPVVIAGLIIFNTMLSSIAERKREIYIYTSLGLAPIHVGFLFLAEAVTYGLMGSIFGYIAGQGTATAFSKLGWMGGLTLNYSGTQAILTMVTVLGVVILSSLVPAFMAGKLATPSNEMRWKVPEPENGVIRDKLPFTVTRRTANGVMAFLYEYLDAHKEGAIGTFSSDDLRAFHIDTDDTAPPAEAEGPDTGEAGPEGSEAPALMGLEATVWLAPYDLGIRQRLRVLVRRMGAEEVYSMHVELERQSGQESSWRKMNRVLLSDLRKQLLGWRKLKLERMLEYIAEAKEKLGGAAAPQ